MDRRKFLLLSSASALATFSGSRLALSAANTEKRLVLIILRGGLDALHAVPPYADKDYRSLRPNLAIGMTGDERSVIDIDGYFGLHPALKQLKHLYDSKELLIVPASASRYRRRSHFDAQNFLENGSGKPFGLKDGWLNRSLIGLDNGDQRNGLALGPTVPLILQGKGSVQTWSQSSLPAADEDFLKRLESIYVNDPLFAKAYADARGGARPTGAMEKRQKRKRRQKFSDLAKVAGGFLKEPKGPRVAVMEIQGWDTHFGQNRRLNNLFQEYSEGLVELKSTLGNAWSDTAVLTVSEFGRTVAENGSRGTDHGTGGLAFIAGGAVNGGRIIGDWPGLQSKALYEERDLMPTIAYESLFKAALISHLGLKQGYVEDNVFPNSIEFQPSEQLFREV